VGRHAGAGHPDLAPRTEGDGAPELAPLLALDEDGFAGRFRGTAIMRAKRDGFVRNVCVAMGNVGRPEDLAALIETLEDRSPLVRGHAAWAIGRLVVRLGLAHGDAMAALEARLAAEEDGRVREELMAAIEELADAGVLAAMTSG
jgi:epoxyqueuosine reductase